MPKGVQRGERPARSRRRTIDTVSATLETANHAVLPLVKRSPAPRTHKRHPGAIHAAITQVDDTIRTMTPPPAHGRPRPPALRDVAELAGVSIKTVSNVVNDYPHVSASTRAKVEAAIEATGYRPQLAAQQLRTGSSGILTLAVPSLRFDYFADLAQRFVDVAQTQGRTVLLHSTSAGRDEEIEVLRGFRRRIGDGVIFNPLLVGEEYLAAMERVDQPTVFIGEHLSQSSLPPGSDYVRIDNTAATAEATAHLLSLGRRRLAFLGSTNRSIAPDQTHSSSAMRLAGFRQALDLAGLASAGAPARMLRRWHRQDGHDAVRTLLSTHSDLDGIVCGNDDLAQGALSALHEAGIRVPEEVAVIGFDDFPDAAYSRPGLSSVSPDKDLLVHSALEMLMQRIEGYDGPPRTVTVPHRLALGASSVAQGEEQ